MTLSQEYEILLVEDDPVDAELTISALKNTEKGVIIHTATDGAEALEYLFAKESFAHKNTEAEPKVIFLDLKLPKVNGLEVLQRIRLDIRTRSIPVVILSSSHEASDVQACYRLGANSYVVKPVDAEQFMKTVSILAAYWIRINEVTNTVQMKFS